MTKYLLILAVLLMMIACGGEDQSDKDANATWMAYAGFEWSPRSENKMTWQEAVDYCEAMGARLPNINELRKIIINCPNTEYAGTCQVSDPDCLYENDCWVRDDCKCDGSADSYSALGDEKGDSLWSSSSGVTYFAWAVSFDDGNLNNYYKIYFSSRVRCVR